jgi:hypothetical protein
MERIVKLVIKKTDTFRQIRLLGITQQAMDGILFK